MTNRFAIIVAGGSGSRMKSDVPKQFLLLHGKPILQHTLEKFLSISPTPQLILVLPARDRSTWEVLCQRHNFQPVIQTVDGGATRFQSVRNGLRAIGSPDDESLGPSLRPELVAIHDGVRPFVSPDIIQNSYEIAARTGSAVACVRMKDSVRQVGPDGSSMALDRSTLRLIQTPQTFELSRFRQAFQTDEQPFFTDCASVMEHAGFPITLINGSYENIKITTPDDLP